MVSQKENIDFGNLYNQQLYTSSNSNDVGSIKTIPHQLTVAGEATTKSSTSNIIVIISFKTIISLEAKHYFFESSSTEFISSNYSS